MNLISKTLTRVKSSSLSHSRASYIQTQKGVISQQIRLYAAQIDGDRNIPEAEETAAETELARPKTIEYQSETDNCVNLIGFVDQNVQFNSPSHGKFWAGTVLSQRSASKSSNFWIPIIFEGELAKIAAHYLKKNDRVHVSGKLFTESPPPNVSHPQSNVQIMVQKLNFVEGFEAVISPPEQEVNSIKKQFVGSKKIKVMDEETTNSWKRLLENPKEWWDYRGNKANGLVKPKHPDFKSKDGSLSLWMNGASDGVLQKLEGLEFDDFVPQGKLKQLKGEESWKDLAQNPDKWWDNRLDKKNPKAPDFKHKETGEVLWMTDSPTWVLSKLPPLKKNQEQPLMANTISQPTPKQQQREESWKDLVENSDKWWDKRSNKTNPKAPDFKHKETAEALWVDNAPTWVLSKLPPLMTNTISQPIPIQREEFWKDLVHNPDDWWDNRSNKKSAKSPDFKHKETGEALWMSGSPAWALSMLPPIKKNQETAVMAHIGFRHSPCIKGV